MSIGELVAFSVIFVGCKNEQSKTENSSANSYVCAQPPTAEYFHLSLWVYRSEQGFSGLNFTVFILFSSRVAMEILQCSANP